MRRALILSAALLLGFAFAPAAPSAAPSASPTASQADGLMLSSRSMKKKKVTERSKMRRSAKRSGPGEATKRSGTQGREPGTGSPPVNRN